MGTKRLSLGTNRLGTKDPWVRNDWIPGGFVNRHERVFSKGNSYQVFCYISFSKDEQFSSKFFEESFFCVPNYIIISPLEQ